MSIFPQAWIEVFARGRGIPFPCAHGATGGVKVPPHHELRFDQIALF